MHATGDHSATCQERVRQCAGLGIWTAAESLLIASTLDYVCVYMFSCRALTDAGSANDKLTLTATRSKPRPVEYILTFFGFADQCFI